MKTFKVDVPDDQVEFVKELLESLNFLSYKEEEPEPRNYIAEDYMVKKGIIPDSNSGYKENIEKKKAEQLYDLRQAINSLQSKRPSDKSRKQINFRLPASVKNGKASDVQIFSELNNLIMYLENYLRVKIHNIEFKANKKKVLDMDNFQVIAVIKEAESDFTRVKAGFSDLTF